MEQESNTFTLKSRIKVAVSSSAAMRILKTDNSHRLCVWVCGENAANECPWWLTEVLENGSLSLETEAAMEQKSWSVFLSDPDHNQWRLRWWHLSFFSYVNDMRRCRESQNGRKCKYLDKICKENAPVCKRPAWVWLADQEHSTISDHHTLAPRSPLAPHSDWWFTCAFVLCH